ncbi:MAG: methylated-DNA--[protein]-cysteine S-methyltransferase [Bacteroidia bacterium]|nr:methylated-DNA--[protein]-cysteine S-methyltransferase [Bacteroidia bacterium]HQV01808.1 methylated-DNA--[protein]-cysteine S-methyltransferase [Bacteroidia bacterium]
MKANQFFKSPIGNLMVTASQQGVTGIGYVDDTNYDNSGLSLKSDVCDAIDAGHTDFNSSKHIQLACMELQQYFDGHLKQFTFPIDLSGTNFQMHVWQQLQQIEFGKTISYRKLALLLGDVKCIRAAASANGKNPLAIAIPCHRVIGSNGNLIGYAGGLWRKKWLLQHEGVLPNFELNFNG